MVSPLMFTAPQTPSHGILFEGIWQILTKEHEYIVPLLQSEPSSLIAQEKDSEQVKPKVLVSGFQEENPLSRVVISGSASICSDKFYFDSIDKTTKLGTSPNRQFCR